MRMKIARHPLPIPQVTALSLGCELDRWRRNRSLTQDALKRISKVSQGQVSRVLAGEFSRATPPVRRMCKAAGIDLEQRLASEPDETLRGRLHAELDRCWDGTEAQAGALMQLLRAARALADVG